MSRVIGVFSGKGGVGKTTLVANLGATLTNVFNKNVVILDSNIHTSHLGLHFGLYEDQPITLREVLKRRLPLTQAVYIHPGTGVRLIPAPLNGEGLELTKEKCCGMTTQLKNNYDIVVLDCAPGLGKEVLAPMQAIDEAIVISTPDLASIADAMKTIELLKKLKKKVLGIVLNRVRNERYELTPQEITSTTNASNLGIIPEDGRVPESISQGIPVVLSYPYSKSSTAFKKLVSSLINQPYTESVWEKLAGIFNFPRFATRKQVVVKEDGVMKKEVEDLTEIKSKLAEEVKMELKKQLKDRIKKRLRERAYGN